MSRLRKAAKATMVAQIFNWASLLLSLATVPLYLHWLGQERYGILLTGLAISSYLMFSDAGTNWASMLLIAQANGRDDRSGISSIVRTSFPLAVCSSGLVILLVAVLCLLPNLFGPENYFPFHREFPSLMIVIGLTAVLTLCFSPFYNLLIGLQESHLAAVYQGAGRLGGTVTAVAIASTAAPLAWVYSGILISTLLTGLLAAFHCYRRHSWAFAKGPFWDPIQVRQQLRTGAKSFVMQAATVFWGTAPVFAITSSAGAAFVPYFSIPFSLLNAPLSILSNLSASLQPGYGEAMGRGETQWVAETVEQLFRQNIVLLSLLGSGFLLLAGPFIHLWTVGRIDVSMSMLLSVLAIAGISAVLTIFRFALTGINRHRIGSAADLIGGLLALGLAVLSVRQFGYEFVGFGVVTAALLTSAWILPRELSRGLGISALWPSIKFWLSWSLITIATFSAGWASLKWSAHLPMGLSIILSGAASTVTFSSLILLLLRNDTIIPARWRKVQQEIMTRNQSIDSR